MKYLSYLAFFYFFCSTSHAVENYSSLKDELNQMMELDQSTLHGKTDLDFEILRVKQAERIQQIVDEYGWPTQDMVGEKASQAAWIIVQHADYDKEFQKKMLQVMHPLALEGKIDPANYAYLYDRTHRPQLYGTQGQCEAQEFKPFPIEDPDQIDTRRRKMKMSTAREYWDMASKRMCAEK